MTKSSLYYFVRFVCLFAFCVVLLGAYTRLSNAGLGCPDWPGCYGHLTVPQQASQLQQVQRAFPGATIEAAKAWKEMIHRYAAGTLGLLILIIAVWSYRLKQSMAKYNTLESLSITAAGVKKPTSLSLTIPLTLCALVLFQALLGMWTVTLQLLPLVVMGHLLGGISIFALLCFYAMHLKTFNPEAHPKVKQINHQASASKASRFNLSLLLIIAVIMVFLQLALGGWVSTNYAGISCIGFPLCNGHLIPFAHFQQAFNLFSPIGNNYEGGLLSNDARATIQMVHRLWAYVVTAYLVSLAIIIFQYPQYRTMRKKAVIVMALLGVQITLGILNVIWMLPLSVAVMHNGTAGLLFISILALAHQCQQLTINSPPVANS